MLLECQCGIKYTIVIYDRMKEKKIKCICGTEATEFKVTPMDFIESQEMLYKQGDKTKWRI